MDLESEADGITDRTANRNLKTKRKNIKEGTETSRLLLVKVLSQMDKERKVHGLENGRRREDDKKTISVRVI